MRWSTRDLREDLGSMKHKYLKKTKEHIYTLKKIKEKDSNITRARYRRKRVKKELTKMKFIKRVIKRKI